MHSLPRKQFLVTVQGVAHFYNRLLHYSLVGMLGTAVHWLVFAVLFFFLEDAVILASCLGFTAGAVVNYTANYIWTFQSKKSHWGATCRFGTVALLLFLGNTALMWILVESLMLHPMVSQVTATALLLPVGYSLNKAITF